MYITLLLDADGAYDFVMDWDNSSSAHILTHDQANVKHTYACAGKYILQLNTTVHGFVLDIEGYGYDYGHQYNSQIIDNFHWDCVRLANKGE